MDLTEVSQTVTIRQEIETQEDISDANAKQDQALQTDNSKSQINLNTIGVKQSSSRNASIDALADFLKGKKGSHSAIYAQKDNQSYQKIKRGPNFAKKKSFDAKPDVGLLIEPAAPTKFNKVDHEQLMRDIDFRGMSSKSPTRIYKGTTLSVNSKPKQFQPVLTQSRSAVVTAG